MKISSLFASITLAASLSLLAVSVSSQTWTPTTAPTNSWSAVASSADGAKLVAAGITYNGDAPVYTSTNSGASWRAVTNISWSSNWSVAVSTDGTKMVTASGGAIYRSSDSGASWTNTSAPITSWIALASSADGDKLFALATMSYPCSCPGFYTSTNSGTTWVSNSLPFSSSGPIAA